MVDAPRPCGGLARPRSDPGWPGSVAGPTDPGASRCLGSGDGRPLCRGGVARPAHHRGRRTEHGVAGRRRLDDLALPARASGLARRRAGLGDDQRRGGDTQLRHGRAAPGDRRLLHRQHRHGGRFRRPVGAWSQPGLGGAARLPGQSLPVAPGLPWWGARQRHDRVRAVLAGRPRQLDVRGRVDHAQHGGRSDLWPALVPDRPARQPRPGKAQTVRRGDACPRKHRLLRLRIRRGRRRPAVLAGARQHGAGPVGRRADHGLAHGDRQPGRRRRHRHGAWPAAVAGAAHPRAHRPDVRDRPGDGGHDDRARPRGPAPTSSGTWRRPGWRPSNTPHSSTGS